VQFQARSTSLSVVTAGAILAETLVRAGYLVALTVSPRTMSPDPSLAPEQIASAAPAATIGFMLVVVVALRLRKHSTAVLARMTSVLLGLTSVATIVASLITRATEAPLSRAVPSIAPLVWIAAATTAAMLAERLFPAKKAAKLVAAGAVVAFGASRFIDIGATLTSREAAWARALEIDPTSQRAAEGVLPSLIASRKLDQAKAVATRCVAAHPTACVCLEAHVDLMLRERRTNDAKTAISTLRERCPDASTLEALEAETALAGGDATGAEQRLSLALAKSPRADLRRRLVYDRALCLDRLGRSEEALLEAKRAVDLGAGRDAKLLIGALDIVRSDLVDAEKVLTELVKDDPKDVEAAFDLALVADKRGDYNGARQGYLRVVAMDASNTGARYNLALLTLRAGAVDEARHHAQMFALAAPGDPRNAALLRAFASTAK